jgi:hypothetical protein
MRTAQLVIRRAVAALALLLALQATALPRLLAQAFGDDDADCCDSCDDSAPGQPCPPLCATCACGHPSQIATPATPLLTALAAVPALRPCPSPARRHDSPDPDGIFHPPRA